MDQVEKPPLGVMPYSIFKSRTNKTRAIELSDAMVRYADADKKIPLEWILELNTRLRDEFINDKT